MYNKYVHCHDCGAQTKTLLHNLTDNYDIEDVSRECPECFSSQTDLAIIKYNEDEVAQNGV